MSDPLRETDENVVPQGIDPLRATIRTRFRRGELARAYDWCLEGLKHYPDNLWLKHRAVLCLTRSGALERAQTAYAEFRLHEAHYDAECRALGARLLKSEALEAPLSGFAAQAVRAAEAYAAIYQETGSYYPAINAASLFVLGGQAERAQPYIQAVLEQSVNTDQDDREGAYYLHASRAEAFLLRGDMQRAHVSLEAAIALDPDNHAARSITLRQLRLLADHMDLDLTGFQSLEPPRPAHFAGHLFAVGEGDNQMTFVEEEALRVRVREALKTAGVGSLYGSLAAGADILVAEAAYDLGLPFHAVLPTPSRVFFETSVRPVSSDWSRRYDACLEHAASVQEVTSDRKQVGDLHLNYASRIAMGLARIQAAALCTRPLQILLWDGQDNQADRGTAHDARLWRLSGGEQVHLDVPSRVRYRGTGDEGETAKTPSFTQSLRAMLFLDVMGSSGVPDDRVPVFVDAVLGRLARACERFAPGLVYQDRWGDGLFLAFESVARAAEAAVTLRSEFEAIDFEALDLPASLALRIGGHFGPVHEGRDPIQRRQSLFGSQVVTAARIEPMTLPGSIYVSESFAALLALEAEKAYRCEYVGRLKIDSQKQRQPIYSLRRLRRPETSN